MRRDHPESRATWRRRWPSIVAGAMALALVGLLIAQTTAVRSRRTGWQWWQECGTNLKRIAAALSAYALDNADAFPRHPTWTEDLRPYVGGREVHVCPSAPEQAVGYAYAEYLAGRRQPSVPHPHETFAFWDCREGGPHPAFRHGPSMNVAYVDGHVRHVTPDTLFWHCAQFQERELGASTAAP